MVLLWGQGLLHRILQMFCILNVEGKRKIPKLNLNEKDAKMYDNTKF